MKPPKFAPIRQAAVILGVFFAASLPASAAETLASDWAEGTNNKARLLAGHVSHGAVSGLYAGVEIEMPPGWKTYWRTPGESGVPPEFDWQGSRNLASAQVLYPAPHRLHDKGGDSIGYKDHVIFPALLSPKDPSQPIEIHVKVTYGVCKDICIPAETDLQLNVPADAGPSETLADVLEHVPRRAPGNATDPKLASWKLETVGGKPELVLQVTSQSPDDVDLIAEGPGGTYVPLPKRTDASNGNVGFEIDLTDGVDIKDLLGKPLVLTMIDGRGQSETTITLESDKSGATVQKQ
jgi:DsbC/DsbD-like thiol-disulfide interchange protein